jgi:HK97 gp10 family phage protein
MSVKVKGLDKAIRELSRSGDRAVDAIKYVLAETATNIEDDAKNNVPFEVEGIPLNIKGRIDKLPENQGLLWTVGIQGTTDLDAYVEFGTGQSAREILYGPGYTQEMRDIAKVFYKNGQGRLIGQPFLFPAWIKHTANLVEELKSEVAKAIK